MLGLDPLRRDCRPDYPAYRHSGPRTQAAIRYIVIHVTESPSAESSARYFMSPQAQGSANLVVDWRACFRSLGDMVIPWGAPPLNTHGFHIEHAGYATWSRTKWLTPLNRRTMQRGAYKAALRCKWYGIPPVLLNAKTLERDFGTPPVLTRESDHGPMRGGIVTHRTINAVYHESDHSCPGVNFPTDVWMNYLQNFLRQMHAKEL